VRAPRWGWRPSHGTRDLRASSVTQKKKLECMYFHYTCARRRAIRSRRAPLAPPAIMGRGNTRGAISTRQPGPRCWRREWHSHPRPIPLLRRRARARGPAPLRHRPLRRDLARGRGDRDRSDGSKPARSSGTSARCRLLRSRCCTWNCSPARRRAHSPTGNHRRSCGAATWSTPQHLGFLYGGDE